MASAEREPITGVWGRSPPEAKSLLAMSTGKPHFPPNAGQQGDTRCLFAYKLATFVLRNRLSKASIDSAVTVQLTQYRTTLFIS